MTNKNFPISGFKSMKSPSDPNIITYYVWVNFKDLPEGISFGPNPRRPKLNTAVGKQLIGAVKDYNDFDINNRGIVLTAKHLSLSKDRNLTIDFGDDSERFGLVDGGHTYNAIINYRNESPDDIEKYVRLEIIVGNDLDVSALSDARNTSIQVSDVALFELDKKFGFIKQDIKNESYADYVAYKDNEVFGDTKRKDMIPVIDLLRLMFAFNKKKYRNASQVPTQAYSGKHTVFVNYKNEFGNGTTSKKDNIYLSLSKQLPTLVKLYQTIQKEIGEKYKDYKQNDGKRGNFGALRGVSSKGGITDFTKEKIPYEVSNGFLMPIFGAFRALLSINNENTKVNWEFDPLKVWEHVGVELVQNTFESGKNPNNVGKTRTVWQGNYRIVANVKQEMLLKKYGIK